MPDGQATRVPATEIPQNKEKTIADINKENEARQVTGSDGKVMERAKIAENPAEALGKLKGYKKVDDSVEEAEKKHKELADSQPKERAPITTLDQLVSERRRENKVPSEDEVKAVRKLQADTQEEGGKLVKVSNEE